MMIEIGYMIGLRLARQKKTITVRLVVPNQEQVKIYQKKFAQKSFFANVRVKFQWMTRDNFMGLWTANVKQFARDVVVLDEGHQYLIPSFVKQVYNHWPTSVVLLSATARKCWSRMEEMSYELVRNSYYIDKTVAFP